MTRTPPLLSSPGRVLAAALLCLPALALAGPDLGATENNR